MIVYSRDLASGGNLGGSSNYDLRPLTFKELLNRMNAPEVTDFRNYIKDLKSLIEMSPAAAQAPIIDADQLIFLMKMVTINQEMKFSTSLDCPNCGKSVRKNYSSKDISAKDFTEIVDAVELNGRKYNIIIPTIEQFLVFVDHLPPYGNMEWSIPDVKLYSLFYDYKTCPPVGLTLSIVDDATYGDISLLFAIKDYMTEGISNIEFECPHCQRGIVIEALSSVADLFRLVLQCNPVDPDKIYIRKISKI